jgi:Uma2 family endonuclease
MDAILEPILQSPLLKKYVKDLQHFVQVEDEKRMHFYKNVTEQQKAEFIHGEMVVQSPVTMKHNLVVGRMFKLLSTFVSINNLGFVGVEKVLVKLTRNDFEPDVCFFREEIAKEFSAKTMFFPAPDFVVEVLSKSTEKTDRTIKFTDYALHGVEEYWIVDAEKETVEQYFLTNKKVYQLHVKLNEGTLYAKAIKKFSIQAEALFSDAACNNNLKKLI